MVYVGEFCANLVVYRFYEVLSYKKWTLAVPCLGKGNFLSKIDLLDSGPLWKDTQCVVYLVITRSFAPFLSMFWWLLSITVQWDPFDIDTTAFVKVSHITIKQSGDGGFGSIGLVR